MCIPLGVSPSLTGSYPVKGGECVLDVEEMYGVWYLRGKSLS